MDYICIYIYIYIYVCVCLCDNYNPWWNDVSCTISRSIGQRSRSPWLFYVFPVGVGGILVDQWSTICSLWCSVHLPRITCQDISTQGTNTCICLHSLQFTSLTIVGGIRDVLFTSQCQSLTDCKADHMALTLLLAHTNIIEISQTNIYNTKSQ